MLPDVVQVRIHRFVNEAKMTSQPGQNELPGDGLVLGGKRPYPYYKIIHFCTDVPILAPSRYDHRLVQTGSDSHKLDGSGDGIVCESLP